MCTISARKAFETGKVALLWFAGSATADDFLVIFTEAERVIGISVSVVVMVVA